MKNLLKFLLLNLVLVSVIEAAGPALPCSFSCTYRERLEYRISRHQQGFSDYDTTLKWYQIEGKAANQDGAENTTFIWRYPYTFVLISPFFDRKTCVKLISTGTPYPQCPTYPNSESTLKETNVACPTDKAKLCDHYFYTTSSYDEYIDTWLLKGTNIPSRIIIENEDYTLTEDYIDFNATVPDESNFEPKPNQPCTDLTDGEGITSNDNGNQLINSNSVISKIKTQSWKVTNAVPKKFQGMTYSDAKKMLIPIPTDWRTNRKHFQRNIKADKVVESRKVVRVPEYFDSRENWPNCNTISTIRNQASCGSCWAFGASESFSDRYCVVSNKTMMFSPQYLVSCSKENSGCNGGYLDSVWYFIRSIGIVSDGCVPYKAITGTCPSSCNDSTPLKLFKSKNAYSIYVPFNNQANVLAIQQEILSHGPVEAAFYVREDFYSYSSGVYQHTKGSPLLGGHAIKVIGWGIDKDTSLPYWLIANSWGEDFGEKGFFRILRGSNECGIETEIAAGIPIVA